MHFTLDHTASDDSAGSNLGILDPSVVVTMEGAEIGIQSMSLTRA